MNKINPNMKVCHDCQQHIAIGLTICPFCKINEVNEELNKVKSIDDLFEKMDVSTLRYPLFLVLVFSLGYNYLRIKGGMSDGSGLNLVLSFFGVSITLIILPVLIETFRRLFKRKLHILYLIAYILTIVIIGTLACIGLLNPVQY